MWLPFERDFGETLELASESATRFCAMLQVVVGDGFDLSLKHELELGVFGNAGWLIAHDAALDLIHRTAEQLGMPFDLDARQKECRRTWVELASSYHERVREAADRDFRENIEADLIKVVRHDRTWREEPADFEYALACLDVYECFLLGVEGLWGDLDYRSRLRPLMEELREQVNRFRFLGFDIPWLPDEFWWRHLPDFWWLHPSSPI